MNAVAPRRVDSSHPSPAYWLCRKHRIAGVSSEPLCCSAAYGVSARERGLWYSERIARKSEEVRTHIAIAKRDVVGCMNAIARCAQAHGKIWLAARASTGTPHQGLPETVRLR